MDKAFNTWCRVQTRFTPDIAALEEQQFHTFFAFDDVMLGCRNYKLIKEYAVTEGRGFTLDAFQFFRKNTDGSQVALGNGERSDLAARSGHDFCRIKGELYNVRSAAIPKLDIHYQNGLQYRRHRVKIIYPYRDHMMVEIGNEALLPDHPGTITTKNELGVRHYVSDEKVCLIEAWIYTGIHSYWDDLIDGGYTFSKIPIKNGLRPWCDKYYQFNKRMNE